MIGVERREPKTPPLVIENVPPAMSSTVSFPLFAFAPIAAISRSMSARDIVWTSRSTGTTSPVGDDTATEMST